MVTHFQGLTTVAKNLVASWSKLHRYGGGRPPVPHALTSDSRNLTRLAEGLIIAKLEGPAVVGCCEVGSRADSNEAATMFDKRSDLISPFDSECGGLFASATSGEDHDVKMGESSFEDIRGADGPGETSWNCLHDLLQIARPACAGAPSVIDGDMEAQRVPGVDQGRSVRPEYSDVLEEGSHHQPVLAGAK